MRLRFWNKSSTEDNTNIARINGHVKSDTIVIHTHIPRCGGTSFVNVLKRVYGEDGVLYDGDPTWAKFDNLELKSGDLSKYRAVSGHICYGIHERFVRKPIYIATVRDPIERCGSAIRFIQSNHSHYLHPELREMNMDDALARLIELNELRLISRQCEFVGQLDDFKQARRVIDKSYYMVAPIERYSDFIALMECLVFGEMVGVTRDNQAPKSDDGFSTKSAARIKELAKEDVLLVEYVRETFARKWDYLLSRIK